jgi:hypothetical protein
MTDRPALSGEPATEDGLPGSLERLLPPAMAFAAAVAAGLLWYALSIATGLIFHFMPGAPFLAAAAAFRWATGSRRATWAEVAGLLAGSSLVTAAGLLAVPAGGGTLDDVAPVAAVVLGGFILALAWLRRPGGRPAPPPPG